MDIKLKYRAWVGEKHADISSPLTNSDIETFAIEFAEWLVKNCFIPDVSDTVCSCRHPMKKKNYDKCAMCGGKWTGRMQTER